MLSAAVNMTVMTLSTLGSRLIPDSRHSRHSRHSHKMDGLTVKVCVLGASRCGKTLLCRTLAEQPLSNGDYSPTAAVRIQELSRQLPGASSEHVKVQLWEVAGDQQFQHLWEAMAKDVDGVMLLIDPARPEQERELEQLYLNFAQRNSLTMKQCMVVGLATADGAAAWPGLTGKLRKLSSGLVRINPSAADKGRQDAVQLLDKLLAGCLMHKKDKMERAVMGD